MTARNNGAAAQVPWHWRAGVGGSRWQATRGDCERPCRRLAVAAGHRSRTICEDTTSVEWQISRGRRASAATPIASIPHFDGSGPQLEACHARKKHVACSDAKVDNRVKAPLKRYQLQPSVKDAASGRTGRVTAPWMRVYPWCLRW